jgi:transcriptional regulator GlxA family with amidase domain
VRGFTGHSIIEAAVAAAMDALPQRLSVREMAAAAGVSLWSLQRAFARGAHPTPVAHVQYLCLEGARRDLERAEPGDTVFAVARRWGFSSPDGAFRDGYWTNYNERPLDTLKQARAARTTERHLPAPADDHVTCFECGKRMPRLRRHLAEAHGFTVEDYRQRWDLPRDYPLVCADLSRRLSAVAKKTGLAGHGARFRSQLKRQHAPSSPSKIDGGSLHQSVLIANAETMVLEMLPKRLDEKALAKALGIGLRALRRAFLDERGLTPYTALRTLRLETAKRMLDDNPGLSPREAASQCGFGHYARFRQDFVARFDVEPNQPHHGRAPGGVRAIGAAMSMTP